MVPNGLIGLIKSGLKGQKSHQAYPFVGLDHIEPYIWKKV